MKFGKLTDIEEVDFSMPPDDPGTGLALSNAPDNEGTLQLFLGCTGWAMKEWVGKVYPAGTKSKDYLREYSRQFNTIELNTTHYRIPDPETITKWYRESAADFRFCPKVPQTISHSRDLGLGDDQLLAFCESVQQLEEKLGCCFLQLPPYFGVDRLGVLSRFVERFPTHIPLAVELRHESWFATAQSREAVFEVLETNNISTVITDVAGRRDVLHMRLTNGTAMVRFVGNGLHSTDYQRIDRWVERMLRWLQKGLSTIYFFPHEPDNILAPDLAVYLWEHISKSTNIRGRGPQLLGDSLEGSQMTLF